MKRKILYVEDEPFLAKVVADTLEHQGFDVCLVSDGALVIQQYISFQPDICILDIMLPNIDGFALSKVIKKDNPRLPLILLTARSFTKDILLGFEVGATDYIRKPFSIEELIARIHNQLKITQQGTTELSKSVEKNISFGQFCYTPERLELKSLKGVLKLSFRENQILSLLVSNINDTIDRRELLMLVWGDDSFFNSRTLDVYIRKLRGYFSHDPCVEIITLKGKGYVFYIHQGKKEETL